MNSVLFQPFRLHDLPLRNRIVLSPMTRVPAMTARVRTPKSRRGDWLRRSRPWRPLAAVTTS